MNRRRTSYPIRWGNFIGVAVLLTATAGAIVLALHIAWWIILWLMRHSS